MSKRDLELRAVHMHYMARFMPAYHSHMLPSHFLYKWSINPDIKVMSVTKRLGSGWVALGHLGLNADWPKSLMNHYLNHKILKDLGVP